MLAVDDYGSFTRAGEELGYTQSGITQMSDFLCLSKTITE